MYSIENSSTIFNIIYSQIYFAYVALVVTPRIVKCKNEVIKIELSHKNNDKTCSEEGENSLMHLSTTQHIRICNSVSESNA